MNKRAWREGTKKKKNDRINDRKKKHFISNGKRENEIQDKIVLPLVMGSMNICATVCFSLLSFRLCSCFHFESQWFRYRAVETKSKKVLNSHTRTHCMHLKYVIDETWQLIVKKSTTKGKPTKKYRSMRMWQSIPNIVVIVVVVIVATAVAAAVVAAATNGYELKCGSIKGTTVASTLIKASTC